MLKTDKKMLLDKFYKIIKERDEAVLNFLECKRRMDSLQRLNIYIETEALELVDELEKKVSGLHEALEGLLKHIDTCNYCIDSSDKEVLKAQEVLMSSML